MVFFSKKKFACIAKEQNMDVDELHMTTKCQKQPKCLPREEDH
jgi:hypothetical protein